MQHRTDVAKVSILRWVRQLAETYERWFRMLGASAAGFVMANCFLFGGVSPFAVALSSALSGADAMGAAAGAVLGYLLTGNPLANFKYILALTLVICVKWLFEGRFKHEWKSAAAVLTCFVCLGICGVASFLLGSRTPYDAILTFAELFLGCGTTYFLARSLEVFPMGIPGAGRSDVSCVAISACVLLIGLTSIQVNGLSVGRILAVLCILLCARYGREAGGAICGVAAGMSVGLAGGAFSYVITAYAFGGLAAGIFGQVGRIATAAAFIVINTATALLTMEFQQINTAIFEVFVASLCFVAIPGRVAIKLRLHDLGGAAHCDTFAPAALSERLGDVSTALREIGSTTRAVSEKLGAREEAGPALIADRVAERVCSQCGMKTNCWQLRHSVVSGAFRECVALLRRDGTISQEQLPRHFQQHCCRINALTAELNTQFGSFLARDGVQRKVAKVRAVMGDQFEGMSLLLEELGEELCSATPIDFQKSERVRDYFTRQNITPQRLSCTVDRFGRLRVVLAVPSYQVARIVGNQTTLDLCALLEAEFDPPEVISRDKLTTFSFCEKATYSVEFGAYQLSHSGSRLCGDAYEFIPNRGGCAHFILSDGMGSGGNAAVDSTMTCSLLARLVSVGVGYEAALKLVNSALLVKSGDESLATVDVCTLDLFTGRANFYKAGAAPTFLIKSGKVGYVETASLPAGILHGVSFETSSVTLHQGDVVVMVSDGVTSTGMDWIKSELSALSGDDVQQLCEKLAVTAKMRRTDGHEDDITVLGMALRKD
jgi:stage II sporulation protein E